MKEISVSVKAFGLCLVLLVAVIVALCGYNQNEEYKVFSSHYCDNGIYHSVESFISEDEFDSAFSKSGNIRNLAARHNRNLEIGYNRNCVLLYWKTY